MELDVWDLDGCLIDNAHRLHEPDFPTDKVKLVSDPVNPRAFCKLYSRMTVRAQTVYLTARPVSMRNVTQSWLYRNHAPYGLLVLRADGSDFCLNVQATFKCNTLSTLVTMLQPTCVNVYDDTEVVLDAISLLQVECPVWLYHVTRSEPLLGASATEWRERRGLR